MSTRNYVAFVCAGTSRIRPKGQKHILAVLTAEGRLVYVVTRERRSSRPFGRASNILSPKKARQASSRLNIASQGVPSSRRIFDSAALHGGPKALAEGVRRQYPDKWRLLYVTTPHPTPLFRAVFNRKRHGGGPLSDCSANLSTCDFSLCREVKMLVKWSKMHGYRGDSS
jgi:hypothetical protein